MKKFLNILPAILAVCLLGVMAACEMHASTSVTYKVDTGDSIKIEVDTTAGFSQDTEVPFSIKKDDAVYLEGSFGTEDAFDFFQHYATTDDDVVLLEEGEKDGNQYLMYATSGDSVSAESSITTEYDYVVRVANSNTCVVLYGSVSEEAAREAFEATTISAAE